ncbi:MAG: hypothetical protein E7425_05760 [Ruminococcaceae bacterium]|jgi:cell division septum initiation protein DivIVA|nr:hypothetical protein [Oscillospiraceae bacterium]
MPDLEGMKRKAQNAAYTAAEKAQDAAAAAGEKAEELMGSAGEKAETLRERASERAGELIGRAGEKAAALKDKAGEKAGSLMDLAAEKAEALKDYAVSGVALVSEKRTLEKNYQALGEWYAAQCVDSAPEAVADIVRAIHESQAKIAELRSHGGEAEPEAQEEKTSLDEGK